METSARFELSSGKADANFTGNYQNGQRLYTAPPLGKSSIFRDGSDIRLSKMNSRVSANSSRDLPTLSQFLVLEPIPLDDSKSGRTGDLKRLLSFPGGNNSEDNPFCSAHLKYSPTRNVEDLKRFRASVAVSYVKASDRVKMLDEHLSTLNKYLEAPSLKKQQHWGDTLTNEPSSVPNLKTGMQVHHTPPEPVQKFNDYGTKNASLSKRLRTSMTETRGESLNNGVIRKPLMLTKDQHVVNDSNADFYSDEEKMKRLSAGGEGWDKKMKRKRSVGAVFSRPVDNEGELKRKPNNESGLQSSESTPSIRSGASGGSNKVDTLPPVCSTARITLKNDQEKAVFSRDPFSGHVKDRPLGKVKQVI